ncbi:hypothetical protein O93_01167 [Bartonella quintana JK 19]|nr:hypothetical protein O93_01167 [Bartonella quintana JK 19]
MLIEMLRERLHIGMCFFLGIFYCRAHHNLDRAIEKNIQQLEEATQQRDKAITL